MKLAEALQERADLNRRIEQLQNRLAHNVVVQEGELPAENPQELLNEYDVCVVNLEQLIAQINCSLYNAVEFEMVKNKNAVQIFI